MDVIVESPDAFSASHTLEGELLEQVQAYWSRKSIDIETAGHTEEHVAVVPDEVVLLTPEPAPDTPKPAIDTAQRVVEDEVVMVKRRVVGCQGGTAGAHGSGHRAPDDLGPR
jgi:hypothetical protein